MGRADHLRLTQRRVEKKLASLRSSREAEACLRRQGRCYKATLGRGAASCSTTLFSLLLLIACLLDASGCNNSCVSGTWNPFTGSTFTVKTSNPPPSCTLNTANGIVHMEIGATATAVPASAFAGPQIAHLFVTLAGLDIHSDALAGDDDPGWQPLAPELQAHPIQVDLLADAHRNSSGAGLPDAVLPAGIYRQIRLRLGNQPTAESAFETNHCGGVGSHCAVMFDGQVRPLVFPLSRRDMRILFEELPGRGLYVPPDSVVTLVIEFDPNRSSVWPPFLRSGDSLLFNPVFRPIVQRPPDAD